MVNAILTFEGFAVKLENQYYRLESFITSTDGTLKTFDLTNLETNALEEYSHYELQDFHSEDNTPVEYRGIKKPKAIVGYYKKETFEMYLKKDPNMKFENLIEKDELNNYKYFFPMLSGLGTDGMQWGFEPATTGDIVKVEIMNFEDPSYFFKTDIYTFKIQPNASGLARVYRDVSHFPPIDTDPQSISYSIKEPYVYNSDTFDRWFYDKNFGLHINGWVTNNQVTQNISKQIAKYFCFIAFRMNAIIIGEIFDFLIIADSIENIKEAIIDNYIIYKDDQNNPNNKYKNLAESDKLIGEILKSWGYFGNGIDILLPSEMFQSPNDFDLAIRYYYALDSFYQELVIYNSSTDLFGPETNLPIWEKSDNRINFLYKILSTNALEVIPVEFRLKMLDQFIYGLHPSKDSEREVKEFEILKIIASFHGYVVVNKLLDFLLEKRDGVRIKYELLFLLLDDNGHRLKRYPIVGWFSDGATHRMHYNFLLYEKWKTSKYNINFVPEGGQVNEDGISLSSFFLTEGEGYWNKDGTGDIENLVPILEFTTTYIPHAGLGHSKEYVNYTTNKDLSNELVVVNQILTKSWSVEGDSGEKPFPKEFEKYHLYQPISIVRFDGNIDFELPQIVPIPAFLFFYVNDYLRLQKFDAALSFVGEVAIEIALFYATGGASAIRHLKYLKYVTEIGRAFRAGTMPASKMVLVWRGAEVGTELVSVSAGVLYSTAQLVATTAEDAATRALMDKLGKCLLALAMLSAGGAVYMRRRAITSANEVLDEVDRLSSLGIHHSIPPSMIDVLVTVRSAALVSKTIFKNRISALTASQLDATDNYIKTIFNTLDEKEQIAFWMHYGDKITDNVNDRIFDLAFWKLMNKTEGGTNGARMAMWKDVPIRFRLVRRDIRFLDEIVKLKITDREAYEHLAIFKIRPKPGKTAWNVTGGHKRIFLFDGQSAHQVVDNNIEILDPLFNHSINGQTSQRMIDYLNGVGTHKHSFRYLGNGHAEHRNLLIKKNPQPTNPNQINMAEEFVLDGVVYGKKPVHTQLNPNWTEADVIHEFAYATYTKRHVADLEPILGTNFGRPTVYRVETEFYSYLLDGTKVKIRHCNFHRYNNLQPFDNHYHYFELIF